MSRCLPHFHVPASWALAPFPSPPAPPCLGAIRLGCSSTSAPCNCSSGFRLPLTCHFLQEAFPEWPPSLHPYCSSHNTGDASFRTPLTMVMSSYVGDDLSAVSLEFKPLKAMVLSHHTCPAPNGAWLMAGDALWHLAGSTERSLPSVGPVRSYWAPSVMVLPRLAPWQPWCW